MKEPSPKTFRNDVKPNEMVSAVIAIEIGAFHADETLDRTAFDDQIRLW